jgi:aspartate dehydrogenase
MILSVGALVNDTLWNEISRLARERKVRVFIPSGAVAGVDGIGSASIAEIESITLTVTKPPEGLSIDPSLHGKARDLKDHSVPVVLFEGLAREAVAKFPKNVNVAAAISLAGIGFDRTRVKVVADPSVTRNQHRVEVKGRFGEMTVLMQNLPSTTNPRTSYLAPLSAISTVRKVLTGIYIGN